MLQIASDPGPIVRDVVVAQMAPEEQAARDRLVRLESELARRIEAEPGVRAVAFVTDLPGREPGVRVEVEGAQDPARVHPVRAAGVAPAFFDALEVPVLAGRQFDAADGVGRTTAVIVSRSLDERLAGIGGAVGRRLRYVQGYRSGGVERLPEGVEADRWYEIVGVVPDFPDDPVGTMPRVYHALAPGHAVHLVIRFDGAPPGTVIGRLPRIAAAIDPSLELGEVGELETALRRDQAGLRLAGLALGLVMLSVLLLSGAGIYALMAFTVALRRREIAVRSALGADTRRLLAGIFARALGQLAAGAMIGLSIAALPAVLEGDVEGNVGTIWYVSAGNPRRLALLAATAALMLLVGLAAAIGPARRGLRVAPTEALREQ